MIKYINHEIDPSKQRLYDYCKWCRCILVFDMISKKIMPLDGSVEHCLSEEEKIIKNIIE